MWTRGKDQKNLGKFEFSLFDVSGALVSTHGGFDTAQEADRAAEAAQRAFLFRADILFPPSLNLPTMDLETLRNELAT